MLVRICNVARTGIHNVVGAEIRYVKDRNVNSCKGFSQDASFYTGWGKATYAVKQLAVTVWY